MEDCIQINSIDNILNPLLEEGFWDSNNINVLLDLPYISFTNGTIDIQEFSSSNSQEIIRLLIHSITIGEYILKSTLQKLKIIARNLDRINLKAQQFGTDFIFFDYKYFNDNFIIPLKFCVIKYISIILSLNNIINSDKTEYLLESNSDEESDIYKNVQTEEKVGYWISLFTQNLIVVQAENNLGTDDSIYETLYNVGLNLNKNLYDPFYKKLLADKCQFLRYKWVMRKRNQGVSVKILKDGNFTDQFINHTSNAFINKWGNLINNHYINLPSNDQYYKTFYHTVNTQDFSSLPYEALHKLIKYAKDIKKEYSLLSKVVEAVKKKEGAITTDYDRYIYNKNYNYALNNKFSLLTSDRRADINEVQKLYNEIKDFQSVNDSNNFFINYKYLKFIENLLKEIHYENIENYLNKTKDLIEKGRQIITDYKKNLDWSRKNLLYLYHLEYNHSIVYINDIPVFVASNYQLPLLSNMYYPEFQELRKQFSTHSYRYEVFLQIQPEIKKVENLEKKDMKDLERLSLFTAVISFIIGGISGFKFIDSWYTALLFLVVLSTSLITFLLVVFIFTRSKEEVYDRNKILIHNLYKIFIGALIIAGMLSLLNSKFLSNNKDLDSLKKKFENDSIKQKSGDLNKIDIKNTQPINLNIKESDSVK